MDLFSSQQPTPSSRKAPLSIIAVLLALLTFAQPSTSSQVCPPVRMPKCALSLASASVALQCRGGVGNLSVSATAAPRVATGARSPLSYLMSFARTVIDARTHLAAAAVARAVSIFGMYPVDTIKTRMQIGQADALRLSGMFKGVTGSLVGQVPYGVLTFGSYEIYKQSLLNRFPDIRPAFIYAMAAVLGDVTGSGWLCPSEVMKQQLQAGFYPSTREALLGIWKKNGMRGFYQGFTGGLARDVPFRVAQLTTFEVTKNLYLRSKRSKSNGGDSVALSAFEAAMCGAAAGSFSAAITNPLDRIKTIMMTDTSNAYGGSVFACASKIVKDEGVMGLFAGVAPRVGYIAPSVCIFFVTYELARQKFDKSD